MASQRGDYGQEPVVAGSQVEELRSYQRAHVYEGEPEDCAVVQGLRRQ